MRAEERGLAVPVLGGDRRLQGDVPPRGSPEMMNRFGRVINESLD